MLNLALKELKVVAKMRGIKSYKDMSEDEVLSAFNLSEANFSKARIEKIRKKNSESRHKFSKSKINDIRRNILELEKNLSKTKKYYDYDDIEYRGIEM